MNSLYKIKDGIVGFAIGDALGVPGEFKDREELKQSPIIDMIGGGVHKQPVGTFSDDTSMTLATMDSIIHQGSIDTEDIAKRFLNWYRKGKYTATNKVFDIGDTTKQALAKYELKIDKPINCGGMAEDDNGNGSLMRILPIVYYLFYKKVSKDKEIYTTISDISSITHKHEISILGCYIYSRYCMFILEGKNKKEAYNELKKLNYNMFSEHSISKYSRILQDDISVLTEDDISSSGYILHTLEAVLWLFINSRDYNNTILKAVNLGHDTDTIAAITGSLLGIYYGIDCVNAKWKKSLKQYDYIINMCEKFEKIL